MDEFDAAIRGHPLGDLPHPFGYQTVFHFLQRKIKSGCETHSIRIPRISAND
jgi:hypothetical protein